MDNNSILPEETIETTEAKQESPASRRYDKQGRRRGRYAYAAKLGWLITLLSLIGVVTVVFAGVSLVRRAVDTTALKEEFYYYLEPVLSYNPAPFEDATAAEQDAFLQAATYRVALAEQNRMLFEHDESCRYAVDDTGRIAVPVEEVETSYNALFGTESLLTHRSLEKDNILYSSSDNCYYVPFQSLATGYT
ncbi:MAG: hypothetical protein IIW40_01565, partial [Clostridia bacterium]|nr:hypothetical protein [Clostridia bacterium]